MAAACNYVLLVSPAKKEQQAWKEAAWNSLLALKLEQA